MAVLYELFLSSGDLHPNPSKLKLTLLELDSYSELDMQRFCLTLVSNEQVRLCFEDPDQNELYYQVAEDSLQQLSSSPEVSLEIIQNEEDFGEKLEADCEDQVMAILNGALDTLKIENLQARNYGLVNISFSDDDATKKYVYYFHCDQQARVVYLISTRNQRKLHGQVLARFKQFADREHYSRKVFSEYTRVLFVNSCPEIFLAFCLQKVIEEGAAFLEVFRTLAFNTVPFILDDPEGAEIVLASDQGIPSNLDSAKSRFRALEVNLKCRR